MNTRPFALASCVSTSNSSRGVSRQKLSKAAMGVAIAMLSGAGAVQAANQWWDINGATAGSTAVSTGAWAGTLWSGELNGTTATTAWVPGNVAIFAAGTNATGVYTVTLAGTQVASGITFEEGTVTLAGGTLNLNNGAAATTITTPTAAALQTISSAITDTTGLIKAGGSTNAAAVTGVLVLSGNNTGLAGPITINAGAIRVSNSNGLGASGAANAISFNPTAAFSGTQLQLSGAINVNKDITLNNGGLRANNGQLTAVSGNSTFSGNITIKGSISAEGAGLASFGATAGNTLTITGPISNVAGDLPSSQGAWLGKTGAGTVVLANANPNFIASMRVFNGTLEAQADGAFGTPSHDGGPDGSVVQAGTGFPQSTIAFRAPAASSGFTYSNPNQVITTGNAVGALGVGDQGRGLIDNLGGNNIYNGIVRWGGDGGTSTVMVTAGVQAGSLEFAGKLYASGTSPRNWSKVGTGEMIISGKNDGTDGLTSGSFPEYAMNGTIVVKAGQLTLRSSDATAGEWLSSTGAGAGALNWQVNTGGTLFLDNSLAINNNRIDAGATVTLAGGELKFGGNATTASAGQVGTLAVTGDSIITVTGPAGGALTTFNAGSPNRGSDSKWTLLLRGMDATHVLQLGGTTLGGTGAAGNPHIAILPYALGDASATGTGTDFVTIDGGVARTLAASEYANTITNGDFGDPANSGRGQNPVNINLTAAANLTAPETTVNSIKWNGAGTSITLGSSSILDINSGALAMFSGGTGTISGGTLNFGVTNGPNAEGIITVFGGNTLTIASNVSGQNGITKSGAGTLVLTGTNNTYGTQTTVNAGVLSVSGDLALGQSGVPVTLNGGAIQFTGPTNTSRSFHLNSPASNTVDLASTNLTLTGGIDGVGPLNLTGTGTVVLDTNAFHTGGTTIAAGVTLQLGDGFNNGQIVSGNIVDNGLLVFNRTGDYTSVNPISGSGSVIWNGPGNVYMQTPGNNNTWTGAANELNAGMLDLVTGGMSALGNSPAALVANYLTIRNNAILRDEGTGVGTTFSTATKGITIGVGGATLEIVDSTAGDSRIALAPISGQAGITSVLTKTGAAELRLAAVDSFTKLVIKQGMIRTSTTVGGELAFGALPAAPMADQITIDGGWLGASNAVALNANRGITLGSSGGSFDATAGSITINGNVTGPGGLTVGAFNPNATAAAAAVILAGTNDYTGGTTVNAGTLQMGNGGTTGLVPGDVSLSSFGLPTNLNFNITNTYAGSINGSGIVTKVGTTTTTLTGNNSYDGGTVMTLGTLAIGADTALGQGGRTLTFNGGYLRNTDGTNTLTTISRPVVVNATGFALQGGFDVPTALTFTGTLAGSGALTKIGAGVLTLPNDVSGFKGGFVVNGGTLLSTVAHLGTVGIQDNANVQLDHAAGDTYTGIIGGSGSLTKASAGVLNIGAPQAYTGATVINNGTLRMASSTNTGTVPTGALLHYNFDSGLASDGSVTTAGVLVSGAVLAPGAGIHGAALQLPSVNSVMTVGATAATGAVPLTGGWTTSAWFNGVIQTASVWRTLFRAGVAGDHETILQNTANSNNLLGNYNGAFRTSGFDIGAYINGWHQLTAVSNGGSGTAGIITFYLDGTQVGTSNFAAVSPTDVWAIGAYQLGNQRFANYIDEAYVYGSALDSGSVQQLYLATAGTQQGTLASTSQVQVAGGATWDLNGIAQNVGSLAGAGSVTAGAVNLTIGNDGAAASFSGTLSGSGTITKVGTGNQIFASANPYTGPTVVNGGTLQIGNATSLGTIATGTTVNTGGAVDLNGLSTAEPITLAGGGLVNNNTATPVTVNSGITISSAGSLGGGGTMNYNLPLSGAVTITKIGTGTLNLAGAGINLGTGALAVNAGTVNVTGGSTPKIGTLSFTAGKLDLNASKMVLSSTTAANLRTALFNGRHEVAGVAGWDGNGIVSTNAKNDPDKSTAIGYLTAAQLGLTGGTWGTQTGLAATDIVTKLTYYGDINMDGRINADDYALLDRGFAQYASGQVAATTALWANGDVNYDGAVTSADYILTDTAFTHQNLGVLSPSLLAQREAQFGSEYVSQLIAAVPEPTSLSVIGLTGLALIGRRRRQQS